MSKNLDKLKEKLLKQIAEGKITASQAFEIYAKESDKENVPRKIEHDKI